MYRQGKVPGTFERSPVVDLSFQFRIGIDLEPLLKKKALHKDKRWIGVVSFKAFTDGIFSHEEAFNSGPVDSGVDLFHSFNSPFFSMEAKSDISVKVKLVFIFLKLIVPPRSFI